MLAQRGDLAHAALADEGSHVVMADPGADLKSHELLGLLRAHSIYG